MMISTKGRYALRVMIDLAEHQGSEYIPLKGIAERQDISEKYLEGILKVLVQNRLLSGVRGKGGGYRLTRQPEQYTVLEILELTEGTLSPVACLEKNASPCAKAANCRTLPMWRQMNGMIQNYLSSITLADLMRRDEDAGEYII